MINPGLPYKVQGTQAVIGDNVRQPSYHTLFRLCLLYTSSFTVRTDFESQHRFDQCGIAVYADSEHWCKASVEYENEQFQRLGSVVTNLGYSDWATTDISAEVKTVWYRLSRRESDFCIECSMDGQKYRQMRIFHLFEGTKNVHFGIYACSAEASSFSAWFSEIELSDCNWPAHQ